MRHLKLSTVNRAVSLQQAPDCVGTHCHAKRDKPDSANKLGSQPAMAVAALLKRQEDQERQTSNYETGHPQLINSVRKPLVDCAAIFVNTSAWLFNAVSHRFALTRTTIVLLLQASFGF